MRDFYFVEISHCLSNLLFLGSRFRVAAAPTSRLVIVREDVVFIRDPVRVRLPVSCRKLRTHSNTSLYFVYIMHKQMFIVFRIKYIIAIEFKSSIYLRVRDDLSRTVGELRSGLSVEGGVAALSSSHLARTMSRTSSLLYIPSLLTIGRV